MIGVATKPNKIILPYPHPGQQKVLRDSRRFNWLCAGRRWRKTTLCMSLAVESSLRGGPYIWGAPTYAQARIGFEETRRAAGRVAQFNESRMTVTFPSGGSVRFLGLDKYDNLRGLTARGAILDEVQSVKQEAYYEVIRPALLDTGGWFWGIGTSNGHDWFWSEREMVKERDNSMVWNAPTLGCQIVQHEDGTEDLIRLPHPLENPHVDFDEIKNLFRTLPRHVFRREIMSDDDAAPGGLIYENWVDGYPERSDGNVTPEADYIPDGGPIYWGVDDGYVGRLDGMLGTYTADSHPRVIGFYQLRGNGQLCRFDEIYATQTEPEEQIEEAFEKPYPLPDVAIVDRASAQLRGRLNATGKMGTVGSKSSVDEGIKELRSWIAPDVNNFRRFLVHPRCKHFRAEMRLYRYEEGKDKPAKQFDHGPDEARYVTWFLRHERL